MNNIISYLSGKKTYILGASGILVIILYYFKVIPADLGNTILGLLGFGGIITLRSAVTGLGNKKSASR